MNSEKNPPKVSKFIDIQTDEFTNKTTSKHKEKIHCGNPFREMNGVINSYIFQLRHIKEKDIEALCLDCEIWAEEWFKAENGDIAFLCDQENIKIEYNEARTDVSHMGSKCLCQEFGNYIITPDILNSICKAQVLKIRITGDHSYDQPDAEWCAVFQKYCRQFYNNAFDSSAYNDSIAGSTKKTGCFIATACFGDYNHPSVIELRDFRDSHLAPTAGGQIFIDKYYKWSPPFASAIENNLFLKMVCKWLIVRPSVALARIVKKL